MEKKIRAMELIAEGNYYIESRNYKKAPKCFEEAINIDPDDKDMCKYAWYNMAIAYFYLKDYQKAIEYNERVVEIDPQYEMAWNNMGCGYSKLGDNQKAIECFEKAIKLNSHDKEAWSEMGYAYSDLKNYQKAIECYEQVIKIDSRDKKAQKNIEKNRKKLVGNTIH